MLWSAKSCVSVFRRRRKIPATAIPPPTTQTNKAIVNVPSLAINLFNGESRPCCALVNVAIMNATMQPKPNSKEISAELLTLCLSAAFNHRAANIQASSISRRRNHALLAVPLPRRGLLSNLFKILRPVRRRICTNSIRSMHPPRQDPHSVAFVICTAIAHTDPYSKNFLAGSSSRNHQ